MHKISNETEYRQALREKILEEATLCFNKQGIKAVKMDDIANLCLYQNVLFMKFSGGREN